VKVEKVPGVIQIRKYRTVQLGSSDTTVLSITSGRVFYLEGVIVTETRSGVHPTINIYDGPSESGVRPIAPIQFDDSTSTNKTLTIGENVLRGTPRFKHSVVATSSVSGTWITVIGYEE
jgi:hypothetical protein